MTEIIIGIICFALGLFCGWKARHLKSLMSMGD